MNTGSSWSTSSGFGNTGKSGGLSQANTSTNGSFGPSNTKFSFQSGSNPNSTPSTSGGLFGNKPVTTGFAVPPSSGASSSLNGGLGSTGASSGLFGNSSGTNPQSGGLFANSSNTGNNITGQTSNNFGSGNTAPNSQLFGNTSNSTATQSGGLFGNSNTNKTHQGGVFGDSNPTKRTMGNFGAPSSLSNSQSGNSTTSLFGNSSSQANAGTFAPSSNTLGTSFGNSGTQNPQSSGLFGNSNTSSGGLFGAKSTGSGSLFGISTTQNNGPITNSASSENPYGQTSVLASIAKTEQAMPSSITNSLFNKAQNSKKRSTSASFHVSSATKPSLVSRLAKTFNIFRGTTKSNSTPNNPKLSGVFTQQNHVDDIPVSGNPKSKRNDDWDGTRGLHISPKYAGEFRKLVIKSTPSKFHLIDAEKVFRAKRKRAIISPAYPRGFEDDCSSEDESGDQRPTKLAKPNKRRSISVEAKPDSKSPTTEDTEKYRHNNGYFCSPSLEELSMMTPLMLSEIENFIIGRVGHGQISYIYPVDISTLFEKCDYDLNSVSKELFGRIIKFQDSIVRVYDDDGLVSPEMGYELNVPATITLKTPPKQRTVEDHIKRLQNMTGMEFVTYDPITFNWTFNVKHFSVWGLIDDSETEGDETEDMERLRNLKKKQDNEESEASIIYSRLYQNESYQNELKRQKIERQTRGIPGGWEFDTTVRVDGGALSVKQKSVKNEINQEVNAFKEEKFAHALAANASDITDDSDNESIGKAHEEPLLDDLLFPGEVRNYDYLKHIVNDMPLDGDINELVDEKAYEPNINDEAVFTHFDRQTSLPVSKNWLLQLELANNVDSALAPFAAAPRYSQSALNSINDILFSGTSNQRNVLEQASTPKEISQDPQLFIETGVNFNPASTIEAFRGILLKSDIKKRGNGYPCVSLTKHLSFATVSVIFNESSDSDFLKLASILFDKPDIGKLAKYSSVDFGNENLVSRLETLETRDRLAAWLKAHNTMISSFDDADPLEQIFSYVCSGDLKFAIGLATTSNNLHLASLLTLIDSNDPTVRSIARNQLQAWEDFNELGFVPKVIVKIFKILAGDFKSFHSELPVRILLSIYVLYGNPAESIDTIFAKFAEISGSCHLSEMLKIYSSLQANEIQEVGHQIVASQLSKQLKWLIVHVLSITERSERFVSIQNSVGLSYGSELEKSNLWKEAIYVYSSMTDDALAKAKIRNVVIENVAEIVDRGTEQEHFLIDMLQVPRGLLYEAYAIEKRRKRDFWGSGEALVVAGLWDEAHDIICDELGPAAIIEEDSTLITRLRAIIIGFPESGSIISRWNQGAGFYEKYFKILEEQDIQTTIESTEIDFLLVNGANLQTNGSFTSTVSSRIAAKRIGDIAIEYHESISDLSQKILALKLGENERNYLKSRLMSLGLPIE
ncbi:hypothetical protein JCM33374_g5432 [Metschnikowia sp. JCM 33374]|nr:hypothetical protein JCM33374_g5432 [Metschnikowia sp. JCM 33374]